MSSTSQQPDSPLPEELVAYLDGELPPADCRAVEDRLANDEEYRQQLRDLDRAWEALDALPAATVDDHFAKTTIELAGVAAQEDLSQRKSLAAVESRSRLRWWMAGGVAAALMAFIMVRALMAHRNNTQLADLPVIGQVNTLTLVPDIDFLRKLSNAVKPEDFVRDKAAFDETLLDYTKASAPTIAERRTWVESLTTEKKAQLADDARAFDELRHNPEEKRRIRELTDDINRATDDTHLRTTLVAYGQWLARHKPGEQEKLRTDFAKLSTNERVNLVRTMVERENEQIAHHLDESDAAILKAAIAKLAKEKQAELLQRVPAGDDRDRIAKWDVTKPMPQILILGKALMNNDYSRETSDALVNQLSPAARNHWQKVAGNRRARWEQLSVWIHEALKPQWGPADLEKFFNDENNTKLTNDERARLLDLPRSEMRSELEKLYLSSEAGIDNRLPMWREFESVRGPRGPGGDSGRPRDRGPGFRPDGPPPGEEFGPPGLHGGPPLDRDGRPIPPDRIRGRRGDDRREGGRPDGPRLGPSDGPPPGPPPPPPQQPPAKQEAA